MAEGKAAGVKNRAGMKLLVAGALIALAISFAHVGATGQAYASQEGLTTAPSNGLSVQGSSSAKSKYGLVEKNGYVYPCDSKGKKLAKSWKVGSVVNKLFIAANAKKVPSNLRYSYLSTGISYRPVQGNFKSIVFLTKKGKSACKTIEAEAFEGYSQLKTIQNLQKTKLAKIGDSAFANTGLTSVRLPKTVTSIGKRAFYRDVKLKSVAGLNKTKLKAISDYAFSECSSLATVALPSTVSSIGYSSFSKSTKLKNVSFGSGLKSIDDYAFAYCESLESASFPASLKTIGSGAFYGCTSLANLTMPSPDMVVHKTGSNMYSVFGLTPLADGMGAISVPSSLLYWYSIDAYANPWQRYCALFTAL